MFWAFFGFYSLGGEKYIKKTSPFRPPSMVRKGQKGWLSVFDGSAIRMENRKRGTA